MPSESASTQPDFRGPRVGIACSDHRALLRYGATLRGEGLLVTALTHSHMELLLESAGHEIDVAILDTDEPQETVARAVSELRARLPHTRVLLVARASSGRQLRDGLKAGADGLILAHQVARALPEAVRAVHAGLFCAPPELRGQTAEPRLSRREHQAVALAADGLSNTEIAAQLALSESTVKSHLSAAFGKLGVASRQEAAARLAETGQSDKTPTN
jgi:two-component system response regulator DesR